MSDLILSKQEKIWWDSAVLYSKQEKIQRIHSYRLLRLAFIHKCEEKKITGVALDIMTDFFSKYALNGDLTGSVNNTFAKYQRFLNVVNLHLGGLDTGIGGHILLDDDKG